MAFPGSEGIHIRFELTRHRAVPYGSSRERDTSKVALAVSNGLNYKSNVPMPTDRDQNRIVKVPSTARIGSLESSTPAVSTCPPGVITTDW